MGESSWRSNGLAWRWSCDELEVDSRNGMDSHTIVQTQQEKGTIAQGIVWTVELRVYMLLAGAEMDQWE